MEHACVCTGNSAAWENDVEAVLSCTNQSTPYYVFPVYSILLEKRWVLSSSLYFIVATVQSFIRE